MSSAHSHIHPSLSGTPLEPQSAGQGWPGRPWLAWRVRIKRASANWRIGARGGHAEIYISLGKHVHIMSIRPHPPVSVGGVESMGIYLPRHVPPNPVTGLLAPPPPLRSV